MAASVGGEVILAPQHLFARRGSLSAPDPFAQNRGFDNASGYSSRLTIIRVPQSREGYISPTCEDENGPRARLNPNGRVGRSHSVGSSGPGYEDVDQNKKRMSFARSSFSSVSTLARNKSPPGTKDSTKHYIHAKSTAHVPPAFPPRPLSLSPQRLRNLAQLSLQMATSESKSEIASRSADSSPLSFTLCDTLPSGIDPQFPVDPFPDDSASFTELPESHYLPFSDRPNEVKSLLSSEANSRLMKLFEQTFSSQPSDGSDSEELDPTRWSFRRLVSYMTECPRSEAPDKLWVSNTRRCIRAKSEVVWERLKDVLGVPPELYVDDSAEIAEEARGEPPETEPEIEELEVEDAWVEPIYPVSSPSATSLSPLVSSPVDGGHGHGVRGYGMETIGEGEEEEPSTAGGGSDGNLTAYSERIRALRLHSQVTFCDAVPASSEPNVEAIARSFSEGHADFGHPEDSNIDRSEVEHHIGSPLFPSDFRRLSASPTLPANNPALRQLNNIWNVSPTQTFRRRGNTFSGLNPSRGSDSAISVTSAGSNHSGPGCVRRHTDDIRLVT